MTPLEKTIKADFTEKYGNDLPARFKKLTEEHIELLNAFGEYKNATSPRDREIKRVHLVDELSDVYVIVNHIATTLGVDGETLLVNALVKSKVREVIPEYMK